MANSECHEHPQEEEDSIRNRLVHQTRQRALQLLLPAVAEWQTQLETPRSLGQPTPAAEEDDLADGQYATKIMWNN